MEFTIEYPLPVPSSVVFDSWLHSASHTKMTGSPAVVSKDVGGKFSAWDGYITGTYLEIDPKDRILMTWRTTDFAEKTPDSLVEIKFKDTLKGCIIYLHHSHLNNAGAKYKQGWEEYYFEPMERYFLSL